MTAIGSKRGQFIATLFHYYRCLDCQFVCVRPFPGFEIYDDAYYAGKGPDPFVDYESEYRAYHQTDRVVELEDVKSVVIRHFQRGVKPPGMIDWLDFGSGSGGLLKYLRDHSTLMLNGKRHAVALTGHDVGTYADRLRTQDQFRMLNLDELSQEPANSFDVISMVEVIEHLPRPAEPISLAARLLKPGGLLVLTTGNFDCRIARRQQLNYRYCIPEIHISLFSPPTLVRLYERFGLRPQWVQYNGVVKFKVLKSLSQSGRKQLARRMLQFRPFVWMVDYAYGVSAMPCAVKPFENTKPAPPIAAA